MYLCSQLDSITTAMTQYFTKSRFKLALDCPTKLYYASLPNVYNNLNVEDDFLQSLAEGGFQVGALAKIYRAVEYDLADLKGYDEPLRRTQQLLDSHENVVIAEAAFLWNNCFVRVDILEKHGNQLHVIEVKAKSYDPEESFINKKNAVTSDILPYVYDVAFQKYVVQNAVKNYSVKGSLMLADKSKRADINNLNQLFRICKNNSQTEIEVAADAEQIIAQGKVQVLTVFDLNDICNSIIAGDTAEQKKVMGMPFQDFVRITSNAFTNQERLMAKLTNKCFSCEFRKGDSPLCDGHDQCMSNEGHFTESDFTRPLIENLWGGGRAPRTKCMEQAQYFMDQLTYDQYSLYGKNSAATGLDPHQRTWLQVGLATQNPDILQEFADYLHDNTYLDVDGLREEMDTWIFPLHMIDFETTAVALPMYKGLRPYEQVAFQFSHHIIDKNPDRTYTIRHAGQFLNDDVRQFPNFAFVRALKAELEHDNGTIFRYANHENSILRAIYNQLDVSQEADKTELMAFIDTITHDRDTGHEGERDMVDLLEVVKRYFYQYDEMHGSNSIKKVLPAVLNTSHFLQTKYAQPIYGKEIKSLNISVNEPISWITYLANDRVDNPYHLLPSVAQFLQITEEEAEALEDKIGDDMTVANGGAALTAYSKLMFCDDRNWDDALRTALLRYCELDTMAMVFIWEYFNHEVNNTK